MAEQSRREPPSPRVNLLWTGGWDSTFRLLELVLVQEVRVRPYYLVQTDRLSTLYELRAMKTIRSKIGNAGDLVERTELVALHELRPDPVTLRQFRSLAQRAHLGPQYEWLARMAKQCRVSDLELSIHVDDKAAFFVRDNVRAVESIGNRNSWQIDGASSAKDIVLFAPFRFPLLELTKTEMESLAGHHGFADILEETWFCHSPRLGKPCGTCPPCQYTREEGMARRIPWYRRLRPYRAAWRGARNLRSHIRRLRQASPTSAF